MPEHKIIITIAEDGSITMEHTGLQPQVVIDTLVAVGQEFNRVVDKDVFDRLKKNFPGVLAGKNSMSELTKADYETIRVLTKQRQRLNG